MSDDVALGPVAQGSAGAVLRAARQKEGLHVAALAAALKVPPRMLEALEDDRLGDLPDLTFARALAQSVCRNLHIDAAPVLALLPRGGGDAQHLEQVSSGLAAPFLDHPGRQFPVLGALGRPVLWATAAVLVAAAAVALWPEGGVRTRVVVGPGAASAPAAATGPAAAASDAASGTDAVTAAAPASAPASALVETVFSAPPTEAGASDAVGTGPLVLRATAETWIEALDGGGQVLLSRNLQPGETLSLDGALPLRLRIGNVAGTSVTFRGVPVDLSQSRDNTARLELR